MRRVDRAKDPNFWTARVNRLVLHKQGGSTLLAWVGHHDDAWAERRRLDVHLKTDAAQLVEIREKVEEVTVRRVVEEDAPPALSGVSAEDLAGHGVPEDWVEDALAASEDELLEIASHLPAEAAEAVLTLATGGAVEPPAPEPVADPFEHPEALRRFRVMEDREALGITFAAAPGSEERGTPNEIGWLRAVERCGGTALTRNWIVTAPTASKASGCGSLCSTGMPASPLPPGPAASRRICTRDTARKAWSADLAFLKLEVPLPDNFSLVRLATHEEWEALAIGDTVIAQGWGTPVAAETGPDNVAGELRDITLAVTHRGFFGARVAGAPENVCVGDAGSGLRDENDPP